MKRFSRRALLGAASGAALLPLLPSLRARAEPQAFPKRLVLMYTPNGVIQDAWWPTDVQSETEFTLGESHEPLAAYRSRLLIPGGIDLKVAAVGPGGPHQRGIGSLFTGTPLAEGEFVDGCGSRAGWATGISVDQAVANVIGTETPMKSMELGVRATENDVQGRISYAGPEQPLPPMNDPLTVYERLFQGFIPPADGAPDEAAQALIADRKSVLDAVSAQFTSLAARVSSEDREKLDQHLTLVRDVERRLSMGLRDCAKPEAPPALDGASETDMQPIAELSLDLLALAFACDATRVASFQVSTALNRIRYPWLDSLGEGHSLSHAGSSDMGAREQLVTRQKWHAKLVAHLFDRLAAIPEGDGSVLDNTLFLWGNEISVGSTHTHENMPFVVAGGGWAFKTGRYVQYQGASHSDLLVAILNAMGVEATTFGLSEYCTGPLTGLSA